ncbi:MAG: arsenate reductase (glutaredoxin) [Halieaceae bacterium]|jgi:arsenate reductase|nr:arsenate reductase (glutaredoxin) [Halieaceae bacterium]
MSKFTIYHNPRCSKSRNTLALLEAHGVTPDVVLYLETPPDREQIGKLLSMLGMSAGELVRRGEQEYRSCGLDRDSTEEEIVNAMAAHPRLIERPIVVKGKKAVLGRPPENVLELIG